MLFNTEGCPFSLDLSRRAHTHWLLFALKFISRELIAGIFYRLYQLNCNRCARTCVCCVCCGFLRECFRRYTDTHGHAQTFVSLLSRQSFFSFVQKKKKTPTAEGGTHATPLCATQHYNFGILEIAFFLLYCGVFFVTKELWSESKAARSQTLR